MLFWGGAAPLLVQGCAYYNTFFNAQRAYDDAEKSRKQREVASARSGTNRGEGTISGNTVTANMRAGSGRGGRSQSRSIGSGYDVAIEKAAKVIKYYPDSKWVDDALLLMAKSYFRLGDFSRSLRKTDELFATFPESDLISEARYWRGMDLWQMGRRDEAYEALTQIIDTGDSEFRGDAAFALAEMAAEEDRLDRAAEYYRTAVAAAGDPIFRYEARQALGDQLMEAGRPAEAAEEYRKLLEPAQTNEARYGVLLKIVEADRRAGNHGAAISLLQELLDDERYFDKIASTKIELANTFVASGETERAILLYQEVIDEGETERFNRNTNENIVSRTEEARRAHYYLGELQQGHFRNLDRASYHYQIASGTRGGVGDSASVRLRALERWADLHEALRDTSDSLAYLKRYEPAFALADHFLNVLDDPDSAFAYFEFVRDSFPNEPLARRATYAIGWLWWFERGDTTKADSTWQPIMADTTGTPVINELQRSILRIHGEAMADDPAEEPFMEAETLWQQSLLELPVAVPDTLDSLGREQWWDDWRQHHTARANVYRPLLDSLVARYPESMYAAHAGFILGWTAENVARDTAGAYRWYSYVADRRDVAPKLAEDAAELITLRAEIFEPFLPKPDTPVADTLGVDSLWTDSPALDSLATDSLASDSLASMTPDSLQIAAPDTMRGSALVDSIVHAIADTVRVDSVRTDSAAERRSTGRRLTPAVPGERRPPRTRPEHNEADSTRGRIPPSIRRAL